MQTTNFAELYRLLFARSMSFQHNLGGKISRRNFLRRKFTRGEKSRGNATTSQQWFAMQLHGFRRDVSP